MSKKKMRAFAGAMAVVLAFVPFLSGCAANDAEDNPQAQQELNADEQSRNEAEGSIGDESGAELEGRTLSADDVIVMRGTGSGTDFKPTTIEILDVAGAGTNADDARVPQGVK